MSCWHFRQPDRADHVQLAWSQLLMAPCRVRSECFGYTHCTMYCGVRLNDSANCFVHCLREVSINTKPALSSQRSGVKPLKVSPAPASGNRSVASLPSVCQYCHESCSYLKHSQEGLLDTHDADHADLAYIAVHISPKCRKVARDDTAEQRAMLQDTPQPWLQLQHINGYTGR